MVIGCVGVVVPQETDRINTSYSEIPSTKRMSIGTAAFHCVTSCIYIQMRNRRTQEKCLCEMLARTTLSASSCQNEWPFWLHAVIPFWSWKLIGPKLPPKCASCSGHHLFRCELQFAPSLADIRIFAHGYKRPNSTSSFNIVMQNLTRKQTSPSSSASQQPPSRGVRLHSCTRASSSTASSPPPSSTRSIRWRTVLFACSMSTWVKFQAPNASIRDLAGRVSLSSLSQPC